MRTFAFILLAVVAQAQTRVDWSQIKNKPPVTVLGVQGNGSKAVTITATPNPGDCAIWDSVGKLTSIPCPTGGSSLNPGTVGNIVKYATSTTGSDTGFAFPLPSSAIASKQGNATTFLMAGTISGSAAVSLCTDANGNATTTGCPNNVGAGTTNNVVKYLSSTTVGDSGVAFPLPYTGVASGARQGDGVKFLMASTISASAAQPLCTDGTGNATTSGCATGSAPSFSVLTSGTNTTAAMVVGTGASLSNTSATAIQSVPGYTWGASSQYRANATSVIAPALSIGTVSASTSVIDANLAGYLRGSSTVQGIGAGVGNGATFNCAGGRGTYASPTAVQSGDTFCSLSAGGYNGTTTFYPDNILFAATEAWSSSAMGSKMILVVTPNGSNIAAPVFDVDSTGLIPYTGMNIGSSSNHVATVYMDACVGGGCGGGGSPAFGSITSGTNTTAAMIVGTGASLANTSATAIASTPGYTWGTSNVYRANSTDITAPALSIGQVGSAVSVVNSSLNGYFRGSLTVQGIGTGVGNGASFSCAGGRGSYASPTAVQSADNFCGLSLGGYNGSTTFYPVNVLAVATENWTGSAVGSKLTFLTTPNGSLTGQAIFDIDSTGLIPYSGKNLGSSSNHVNTLYVDNCVGAGCGSGGGSPGGATGSIQYKSGASTFGGIDLASQVSGRIQAKAPTAVGGCGLAGDGSTDDTTAFNTCVNASSTRAIEFACGVYILGGAFIGNGNSTTTASTINDISLIGAGDGRAIGTGCVVFKYPASGATGAGTYVLRTKGSIRGVTLSGIAIHGNNRASRGLWWDSCNVCTVKDVSVTGAAGIGDAQIYVDSTMNFVSSGHGCFSNWYNIFIYDLSNPQTIGLQYDSTLNSGGTADSCSNHWYGLHITTGGTFPGYGIKVDNTDNLHIFGVEIGAVSSVSVSSISVISGVATVTTSSAHNIPTNGAVWMGNGDTRIQGNYWATSTGTTTFTIPVPGVPNGSYSTGYMQPVSIYFARGAWSSTVNEVNTDAGVHWQNDTFGFNAGSIAVTHFFFESNGIVHPGQIAFRADDGGRTDSIFDYRVQPIQFSNNVPLQWVNQGKTATIPVMTLTSSNDVSLQTGGWYYFRNSSGTAQATLKDDGQFLLARTQPAITSPVCQDTSSVLQTNPTTCLNPGAQATMSSNQTLISGSPSAIFLNTEVFDVGNTHDNITNNNRITVPTGGDGMWMCMGQVKYTGTSGGIRVTSINKTVFGGGTSSIAVTTSNPRADAGNDVELVSAISQSTVGDYFEMLAQQTSGGNLDVIAGASNTLFTCKRIQ